MALLSSERFLRPGIPTTKCTKKVHGVYYYIALSCFHDAVSCSSVKVDSSSARKGNGGEDKCL